MHRAGSRELCAELLTIIVICCIKVMSSQWLLSVHYKGSETCERMNVSGIHCVVLYEIQLNEYQSLEK